MTIFQSLKSWRQYRGMDKQPYNHRDEVMKDVEELFELIGYQETDELVASFMEQYYIASLEPTDEDKLDAHLDKVVFGINASASLGYIPELALKETYKHISARKQDPIQAHDWELNGPSGKWEKDPNQDKSELYQPNYKLCKNIK